MLFRCQLDYLFFPPLFVGFVCLLNLWLNLPVHVYVVSPCNPFESQEKIFQASPPPPMKIKMVERGKGGGDDDDMSNIRR